MHCEILRTWSDIIIHISEEKEAMSMKLYTEQEGLIIALSKHVKALTLKKLPKFSIEIFSKLVHVLSYVNGRFSKIGSHMHHRMQASPLML